MSINDPWSYSDMSPPSRATSPIFLQGDGGNVNGTGNSNGGTHHGNRNMIDTELASIVSSLSALSNPAFNNQNNQSIASNSANQMGSFRGAHSNPGSDIVDSNNMSGNGSTTNNYFDILKLNSSKNRNSPLSVGTAPPGFNTSNFFNNLNNSQDNNGNGNGPHPVNNNHAGSIDQRMDILNQYSASINGQLFSYNAMNQMNNNSNNNANMHSSSSNANNNTNNTNNHNNGSNNNSFFEKFGKSLIDGTREIENNNNNNHLMGSLSAGNSLTNMHDMFVNHAASNSNSSRNNYNTINSNSNSNNNNNNNLSVKGRRLSITSSMATDLTAITSATDSTTSSYHELLSSNNPSVSTNQNSNNIPNPYAANNNHGNQYDTPAVRRNIWTMTNFSNLPVFKPNQVPGVNNNNNNDNNGTDNNNVNNAQMDPQNSMANPNMFIYPLNMGMPPPPNQQNNTIPVQMNNPYFYMDVPNQNNNENQIRSANGETAKNILEDTSSSNQIANRAKNNNRARNNGSNKAGKQSNPYLDNNGSGNNGNTNGSTQNRFSKKSNNTNNNNNVSGNRNNNKSGNSNTTSNKASSPQLFHRSLLLEEFRNNTTNKQYVLKDIYGYALEFCKDQHGSRFIQHELAIVKPSEKEVIFNEIRDHILELSDDVFGNYVIQKFFEHGSDTQRKVLVENFKGKMIKLSMQMYACRVIQRALEFIAPEQKIELVLELKECVLPMIKDQNGNHVIQKAIEHISIEKIPFILESLTGQIYHLSTHAYGCRVIQRLLEFGSKSDQTAILDELFDFIPYLIQDQYGNYVIQYLLQQKEEDLKRESVSPSIAKAKQEIINIVSENVVDFSKHKFASNVVEKTILYGNKNERKLIMSKILPRDLNHAAALNDDDPMILMMKDQFANYVVQKLVGVTEGDEKNLIVVAIRSYLDKLNSSNSLGNRHLASVEKLAALVGNVHID